MIAAAVCTGLPLCLLIFLKLADRWAERTIAQHVELALADFTEHANQALEIVR